MPEHTLALTGIVMAVVVAAGYSFVPDMVAAAGYSFVVDTVMAAVADTVVVAEVDTVVDTVVVEADTVAVAMDYTVVAEVDTVAVAMEDTVVAEVDTVVFVAETVVVAVADTVVVDGISLEDCMVFVEAAGYAQAGLAVLAGDLVNSTLAEDLVYSTLAEDVAGNFLVEVDQPAREEHWGCTFSEVYHVSARETTQPLQGGLPRRSRGL
jgi:hypothetical protein